MFMREAAPVLLAEDALPAAADELKDETVLPAAVELAVLGDVVLEDASAVPVLVDRVALVAALALEAEAELYKDSLDALLDALRL
jgi:hypothetical protein